MKQKTKNKNTLKGIIMCGLCVNLIGGNVLCTYADTTSKQTNITVSKPQKNNDLKIEQSLIGEGEDAFMMYNYSYKGMTKEEFKKAGLHIAASFSEDGVNWSGWQDLEMYAYNFGEFGNYGGYMRFAVVDYPMDNLFDYKDDLATSDKTIALSDVLSYNVEKEYKVAPSVMELTPSNQAVQEPGEYKVTAKINDHLKETGKLDIETTFSRGKGLKVEVSNIKIENKTEKALAGGTRNVALVTFDLKTDETYSAHFSDYHFQLKGAVGEESGMEVMPFGLTTAFTPKVYCSTGSFDGVMITEENEDRIINFNVDEFEYAPMTETDAKIVVAKTKDGKTTGNRLNLSCENDVAKFDTCNNISVGVKFVDGFDKDAKYSAYRYVKQANGTYKAVELKTEINSKGLRVFGENTLN